MREIIMKFALTLLVLFIVLGGAWCAYSAPEITKLEFTPMFVPPKHEPTFPQNYPLVERYDLRLEGEIKWERLFYGIQFDYRGMVRWIDNRGSSDWSDADWTPDKWVWDATQRFGVDITDKVQWYKDQWYKVQWYNEYYITGKELCCYWWRTGFKVKFK